MSYGNNYGPPQGGYGQPPQQQGDGQGFWPKVTGFKIGPAKSGKGHVITFTVNTVSKSQKEQPMLFQEFMQEIQKAFQESGGNGIRFVIPFHQGNGPRGPFQSGTIKIVANNPQQHQFGGGGGGRRQYPPQQAQGYGQPQQPPQGQYGNTIPQGQGGYYNNPPQQPPVQQPGPPPQQYPTQGAPQYPPQSGGMSGAPQGTVPNQGNQGPGPIGGQSGPGQPAQNGAYPSDGGQIPF